MFAALPYSHLGPLELFGLQIHPFGVLVGTAIVIGTIIAEKRAAKVGLDSNHVSRLTMWAVIPGFVGAHLYAELAYNWDGVMEDPLILFKLWEHISSFGGFVGGALGVAYYVRKHRLNFLVYAEVIIYGFAFAWIFGRLGCTVAYDHPGYLTDFAMGMAYPYNMPLKDPIKFWLVDGDINTNVRHNLGFYEFLWAVGVSAYFFTQRNKAHKAGFFLAVFLVAYIPVRFLFDFLRVQDGRWLGLTPGQFAAIVLLFFSFLLIKHVRSNKETLVPDGEVHVFADGTPAFVEEKTPASPRQSKPSHKKKKKKR